eukprot:1478734-Rhodomonas_salina.1
MSLSVSGSVGVELERRVGFQRNQQHRGLLKAGVPGAGLTCRGAAAKEGGGRRAREAREGGGRREE